MERLMEQRDVELSDVLVPMVGYVGYVQRVSSETPKFDSLQELKQWYNRRVATAVTLAGLHVILWPKILMQVYEYAQRSIDYLV